MNQKEFCNQYSAPMEFVTQVIEAGILDDFKTEIEDDSYGEEAVRRLEACISLYSLGLDVMTIKKYIFLELSNKDTRKERIHILQKYRSDNLKNAHKTKKVMDCIDCVLRELKTSKS